MKRHRRSHAHRGFYGLPESQRHAYREILQTIRNNPGASRFTLRHWMQQDGIHRALTDRTLSVAERRGHVDVLRGGYHLTARGYEALTPEIRHIRLPSERT